MLYCFLLFACDASHPSPPVPFPPRHPSNPGIGRRRAPPRRRPFPPFATPPSVRPTQPRAPASPRCARAPLPGPRRRGRQRGRNESPRRGAHAGPPCRAQRPPSSAPMGGGPAKTKSPPPPATACECARPPPSTRRRVTPRCHMQALLGWASKEGSERGNGRGTLCSVQCGRSAARRSARGRRRAAARAPRRPGPRGLLVDRGDRAYPVLVIPGHPNPTADPPARRTCVPARGSTQHGLPGIVGRHKRH
jgi:hypothetical protein